MTQNEPDFVVLDQDSSIEHVRHGTRQINPTPDPTRANQGVPTTMLNAKKCSNLADDAV
jgi:hypothetical protein